MSRDLIYIIIILLLGIALFYFWDRDKSETLVNELRASQNRIALNESEARRISVQATADSTIQAERQTQVRQYNSSRSIEVLSNRL